VIFISLQKWLKMHLAKMAIDAIETRTTALSSSARLRDDWLNLCKAPIGIGLLPEVGVLLPWNPETIPSSLGEGWGS
jgi:hypothetical protein